jgi:hypothetical protein
VASAHPTSDSLQLITSSIEILLPPLMTFKWTYLIMKCSLDSISSNSHLLQIQATLPYNLTSQSLMAPMALPPNRTEEDFPASLATTLDTFLFEVTPFPKIMLLALTIFPMVLEHPVRFVANLATKP